MSIFDMVEEECPHCGERVEMIWPVEDYGYKAFCPYCGNRLMLCDECERNCESGECGCDYNIDTDGCRFNPAAEPQDIEKQLDLLHKDGYHDAEQIIRDLLRKVNERSFDNEYQNRKEKG